MTQEIRNQLDELSTVANELFSTLWELADEEGLTSEELDTIVSCALDADVLASTIEHMKEY